MTVSTTPLLGVAKTETPTSNTTGPFAGHALGTTIKAVDGSEFVYVQAGGVVAQYDYVTIDENYAALAGTTAAVDDGHMIGFAQVAFASADFGWVATKGSNIQCNVLASCAADVTLWTSATAGKLDDATTTSRVAGVVVVTALGTAAGNTEIIATWPRSFDF